MDGVLWRRVRVKAPLLDGEVHHHDAVLLHQAHEQDHADERVHVELDAEHEQRGERAEAGEGQRRENREGVDEALVEDAEHHVDDEDGRRRAAGPSPRSDDCEGLGRALELRVLIVAGSTLRAASFAAATASLRPCPGATLKLTVTAGSCPAWFTESGPTPGSPPPASATARAARARAHVQAVEGRGLALRTWIELQDDLVAVVRREDRRDLARAVGAVERVLDLVDADAQRRGSAVAVDLESSSGFLIRRSDGRRRARAATWRARPPEWA